MMTLGLVKYDPRLMLTKVLEEVSQNWNLDQATAKQEELSILANELLAEEGDIDRVLKEAGFFQNILEDLAQLINLGLTMASNNSLEVACQVFSQKSLRELYEIGKKEVFKRTRKAQWLKNREIYVKNQTGEAHIPLFQELDALQSQNILLISSGKLAVRKEGELKSRIEQINTLEKLSAADAKLEEIERLFSVLSQLPWQKIHCLLLRSPDSTVSQLICSLAAHLDLNGDFKKEILKLTRNEIEEFLSHIGKFSGKFSIFRLIAEQIAFEGLTDRRRELTKLLMEKLAIPSGKLLENLVGKAFDALFTALELITDEAMMPSAVIKLNSILDCFFVEFVDEEWSDIIALDETAEEQSYGRELEEMTEHELVRHFENSRKEGRFEIVQILAKQRRVERLFTVLLESHLESQEFHSTVAGWLERLDFSFVLELLTFWENYFRTGLEPGESEVFLKGLLHDYNLAEIVMAMKKPKRQRVIAHLRKRFAAG